MVYRYEIKNTGREEILYLFLDIKNEFAKELTSIHDINDLSRRTKNFIVNNDIKFNGKKVFLIIDGIVVKTVDISSAITTAKNSPGYSNKKFIINIKLIDNSFIEVNLEKYLLGILASTYNETIEDETLKCISILYRTYAYKGMFTDKFIEANYGFIEYRDINDYKLQWANKYNFVYNKLLGIINETECIFMSYNGKYILPFIHFCNNGLTYENKKYDFLSSVSSLWDLACTYNREILDFKYKNISEILKIEINESSKIQILEIDQNNQIKLIRINNKKFTGEELKKLLNLKSLNFNIILYHNFFRIITFGFGNFLGLSIYGSNELAKDGVDYPNILKYYFPKTKLNKYIKETQNK